MTANPRFVVIVLSVLFASLWLLTRNSTDADSEFQLVLYCAHDATYAEQIIAKFEQQTGISVEVRFDEEANKSLGLTNLLVAEQNNPRCDVFWNNQTLGTIRLKQAGILQPYHSNVADRIPDQYKDSEGYWTGFAGRLRVYLVNAESLPATEDAVNKVLQDGSLSRVAIAQPLFGTTLSHYSVLMAHWGEERLKTWHAEIHERGIREARGNSMSKDLVAEGICDIGFTDTDDAFAAIDAGRPVGMVPVRLDNGKTVCLPNSVAIIKNCSHVDNARKFVDFLLSAEVEVSLANSAARQIPLGTVDRNLLPPEVLELQIWAADSVSLTEAADVNQRVLDWLTAEYTGQ
jgi:iron(III) transport system substrate-binding protein